MDLKELLAGLLVAEIAIFAAVASLYSGVLRRFLVERRVTAELATFAAGHSQATVHQRRPRGLAQLALATQRTITNTSFAINNNATIVIEGAIYLPGWTISVSGQVNSAGANCTQMIADRLDLASNFSLKVDCAGTAVKPIGRTKPVLVQ